MPKFYISPKKYAFRLLDKMAVHTIETVTSGTQSTFDNIRTIAMFVDLCKTMQKRYAIDDAEVPNELCVKLDTITTLLDMEIEKVVGK